MSAKEALPDYRGDLPAMPGRVYLAVKVCIVSQLESFSVSIKKLLLNHRPFWSVLLQKIAVHTVFESYIRVSAGVDFCCHLEVGYLTCCRIGTIVSSADSA